MTRLSRRGPWLPEEDGALVDLVRTQGPNNWVRISQQLQHRSPKQCRERYHQNLKPSLNHEPISTQEGEMIEQLVGEMGKRWAEIARRLGNRSDNAVKNWWNGSMNRRKRNPSQNQTLKHVGNRIHPMSCTKIHKQDYELPSRGLVNHRQSTTQLHNSNGWFPTEPSYADQRATQPLITRPERLAEGNSTLVQSAQYGSVRGTDYRQPTDNDSTPFHSHLRASDTSRLPPLRLPPITCSQSESYQTPGPLQGKPLASPTASEFSHTFSTRPVPSLVSDTQSVCSISPKTIVSPRLSAPPLTTYGERPYFSDYSGRQSLASLSPLHTENAPIMRQAKSERIPPLLHRANDDMKIAAYNPYKNILPPLNESMKDSRMHVSSLVQ